MSDKAFGLSWVIVMMTIMVAAVLLGETYWALLFGFLLIAHDSAERVLSDLQRRRA